MHEAQRSTHRLLHVVWSIRRADFLGRCCYRALEQPLQLRIVRVWSPNARTKCSHHGRRCRGDLPSARRSSTLRHRDKLARVLSPRPSVVVETDDRHVVVLEAHDNASATAVLPASGIQRIDDVPLSDSYAELTSNRLPEPGRSFSGFVHDLFPIHQRAAG